MKKYRKPITKNISLESEQLLVDQSSLYNKMGTDQFSKRNTIVTDDEYLGDDISYNKDIFRSSEDISDDATIVNHY